MEKKVKNILLCGVGGQGIILASKVLSEVALYEEYDVKQSEVHGMSQRGGSVVSYVRFGEKIDSPLIDFEKADFIIAFEKMEILRYLNYVGESTKILIADIKQIPTTVSVGNFEYFENVEKVLDEKGFNYKIIDVLKVADKLGNLKTINTIMLGVLSNIIEIKKDSWIKILEKMLPNKILDINIAAFNQGTEIKF
jgi:indolepyruvate ferredoxin oxidoreductase beta subunit